MVNGSTSARAAGRRPSIEQLIGALDQFESLPDREQPPVPYPREPF